MRRGTVAQPFRRGGLASSVVELAKASGRDFSLAEERIPVASSVAAVGEVLGMSPDMQRPGDVVVHNWRENKTLLVDVGITHPQQLRFSSKVVHCWNRC